MDNFSFLHSFVLTDNYAIVFIPPVWWKDMTEGMILNKPLADMLHEDPSVGTYFHMIRLSDGKVNTIHSDDFHMVLHFGNVYDDGKGHIFVDAPSYKKGNATNVLIRDNYENPDFFKNIKLGAQFLRYTFDFDNSKVKVDELHSTEQGFFDFPQHNPMYDGGPTRYTWFTQYMTQTSWTEEYQWPILKFDAQTNTVTH